MEFDDPIVGTTSLIREAIQSPNYQAGIAGWIIRKDGTAEFLDIIARGEIVASELDIDNTNFGGEDRGRIHVHFDDVNIRQEFEWFIGQQNIDDFITGGTPSGAVQSHAAQIHHEVRGSEGPEVTIESGQFNGQSPASIQIFGEAWDGTSPAGIALNPSLDGSVIIQQNAGLIATRMRPETATLASNSGRTLTSTSFTSALGADQLSLTLDPAASGAIQVSLWAQADITAGAGFICFEVRATDATGTQLQAPVDGTGINLVNLAGARISYFFQVPVEDPDFELTDLFIRVMARTTTGGTFTIQRARLTAEILP